MKKEVLLMIGSAALMAAAVSCGGDPYEKSMYSAQPEIVTYQGYLAASSGLPAEGTDPILKTGTDKGTVKKGKLVFKDSNGNGKLDGYEDWRLPVAERVADLVSKMTVPQKLGMLSFAGGSDIATATKDTKGTDDAADDVQYFGLPGIGADGVVAAEIQGARGPAVPVAYSVANNGVRFVFAGVDYAPLTAVKYNNNMQGLAERAALGIPVVFGADPAHAGWESNEPLANKLSLWPYYLGLGALDDLAATKEFGETVSKELRMYGQQLMLGPQADIATEPRWARIQHTLHADGDIAAVHYGVLIKALQGGDDLQPSGIAAVVKHFPGGGSNEEGMDSHTAAGKYAAFPGNNLEEHLKTFEAAFKVKPAGVMALYSIVPLEQYQDKVDGKAHGEGTAFNKTIMTDLLRGKYGFEGFTVSDWGVLKTSAWGHEDIAGKSSLLAEMLNAGTAIYGGSDETKLWQDAYDRGLIADATVNDAVSRALTVMFKLGLFENPYTNIAAAEAFWSDAEVAKRMAAGQKLMSRAIVLAKNDEVTTGLSVLPVLGRDETYIASVDGNKNGVIDIYFDSAYPDADSGQAKSQAVSNADQYIGVNFVTDPAKADLAVVRVYSRGPTYFGTLGGTPLNYTDPVRVWDHDAQKYTSTTVKQISNPGEAYASFASWTFDDWSMLSGGGFVGHGYMTYLGAKDSAAAISKVLAAKVKNPKLKVALGITASRPAILTDYVGKVDALLIDFAATDKAFLDVVMWQAGTSPQGRLPVEFPRDQASVEAQAEDVGGDTANPLFEIGYGMSYASLGGYGY